MNLSIKLFIFTVYISSIVAVFSCLASEQKQELTGKRKADLVHLVKQDCGSCHGMTLKGGLGPALLTENLKDKPLLFIQNTILHGRPGTAMPPWKTILTVKEAEWISLQLQKGTLDEK